MPRLAPTLLALALLVGSAAAFAVAERLKLEPSPILGTDVPTKVFSPVCDCETDTAEISFRLRRAGSLTVEVVDERDDVVRTLADDADRPAGVQLRFRWDGRDDDGAVVPEGTYSPRVRLAEHGRTIKLPNPVRVDTTPPTVALVSVRPRVFSPDGDRRADRIRVRYTVSEPASGLVFVNDRRRVKSRFRPLAGMLPWFGKVRGRSVRPGLYAVSAGAVDVAGNRAQRTEATIVRVRYVELAPARVSVRPGGRFALRVDADAVELRWRFARATGTTAPGVLRLRAPQEPGEYTVYVSAAGHADKVAVRVVAP